MKKDKSKQKQKKSIFEVVTSVPLASLLFLVFVFLVYNQILGFYLGKFDEDLLVLGNLAVLKDFGNLKDVFHKDAFLSLKGATFYRPFQTFTYMIDAHFFGERGSSFYFTNMLLHACTGSVLYVLMLLLRCNRKPAFILTLFFLASPLFVHAVAWAPSRGDLLIGLLSLIQLVLFIKYIRSGNYLFISLMCLAFLLAIFSKETAILMPVLIIVYYFIFEKGKGVKPLAWIFLLVGYLVSMALYFYMRQQAIKIQAPSSEFGIIPFFKNIWTIPEYIAKFFIPVGLSPMAGFSILVTGVGLVLTCFILWAIFHYSLKNPWKILFGITWFLVFIIPGVMYSHTLGSSAYDYLEHRAYLPMMGIIFILGFIYEDIQNDKLKTRLLIIFSILTLAFGIDSKLYSMNYENPMVFYNYTVSSNPKSAMAYNNRGLIKADLKDAKGAIEDYETAIRIKPDYAQAYVNKGITLSNLNQKKEAVDQYNIALKLNPLLFQAHFNKANSLLDLGINDEALLEYSASIRLLSNYAPCYIGRGSILFHKKEYEAAEKDFTQAAMLDGKNASIYLNRGKIRFNMGNKKAACEDWSVASTLGDREARELEDRYCK